MFFFFCLALFFLLKPIEIFTVSFKNIEPSWEIKLVARQINPFSILPGTCLISFYLCLRAGAAFFRLSETNATFTLFMCYVLRFKIWIRNCFQIKSYYKHSSRNQGVREAADTVVFFSGPATKAIPPSHLEFCGHRNFFL